MLSLIREPILGRYLGRKFCKTKKKKAHHNRHLKKTSLCERTPIKFKWTEFRRLCIWSKSLILFIPPSPQRLTCNGSTHLFIVIRSTKDVSDISSGSTWVSWDSFSVFPSSVMTSLKNKNCGCAPNCTLLCWCTSLQNANCVVA